MKNAKKLMSVLLAALMLLSCGVVAFAQEIHWLPYPIARKDDPNLDNGDYYIDFTDYITELHANDETPPTAQELADEIAMYNFGDYTIDETYTYIHGLYYTVNEESGGYYANSFPADGTYLAGIVDKVLKRFHFDEATCNWTQVPTSTAGLHGGNYYIDVQGYVDQLTDENGNPLSPTSAEYAQALAMWSAADYYVDFNQQIIKVTLHFPDGNGGVIDQYVPANRAMLPMLLKVYYNWTPVPTSTDGLNDGDWYIDVPGFVDQKHHEDGSPLTAEEREAELQMWSRGPYLVDFDQMLLTATVWIPAEDGSLISQVVPPSNELARMMLKQYTAPTTPTEPTDPDQPDDPGTTEQPQKQSPWKAIVAFFLRIVNFFKNLFK
ncbi:MAG: hypothetical protein IKN72_00515 [Clostridia bacterium]|nr:hypothetical protein [Clostridia bacterium]